MYLYIIYIYFLYNGIYNRMYKKILLLKHYYILINVIYIYQEKLD